MRNDDSALSSRAAEHDPLGGIDTSVPHSARIWNYWLGGKDNFSVDQQAGDEYVRVFPGIVDIARLSREFLVRAVRYLAGEARIDQFLDIGTGLPTVDNTHEIAQWVNPASSIVYVDNDPFVLVHARALLTSTTEGGTAYIDADLREPGRILDQAARTLDFERPVALMLIEILGHVTDDDRAEAIVAELLAGLPSGSHIVIADGTNVIPQEFDDAQRTYDEGGSVPYRLRDLHQITRFFGGTRLLEPGVVPCPQWRPEVARLDQAPDVQPLGGIGVKP